MTVLALALAASLSLPALAAEGCKGYYSQLTPKQKAEYKKVKAECLNETMALRQQLAANKVELKTLLAQLNPDPAKVKAVADEKVDRYAQLIEEAQRVPGQLPPVLQAP